MAWVHIDGKLVELDIYELIDACEDPCSCTSQHPNYSGPSTADCPECGGTAHLLNEQGQAVVAFLRRHYKKILYPAQGKEI